MPDAKLGFSIDKSRPKGSRFVVRNKTTGERSYRIPRDVFLEYEEEDYMLEGIEETDYYKEVLDQYAEDAEIFMVQAGDHYMWGATGNSDDVASKITSLFREYGSRNFNADDKGSHHYANWFNGVVAYSNRYDAIPYIADRVAHERQRRVDRHIYTNLKYRKLRNGKIGVFDGQRMVDSFWPGEIE